MKAVLLSLLMSGPFTSERLLTASLSADCLGYCVVGVCLWLRCNPLCSLETTLRVSHRVPDLVVSTYNHPGENPWLEANAISGPIGRSVATTLGISGGHIEADAQPGAFRSAEMHSVQFSEVDVFGGIGSDVLSPLVRETLPLCEDETVFLFPYLVGPLNAASWRSGLTEALVPAALIPGLREVGNWGPLYPRMGFLAQAERPKACAVFAQRAASIVSQRRQLHVYTPADRWSDLPRHTDGPGPSNERTDQWQAIYPNISLSCDTFGRDPDFSAGKGADRGIYAWQLWRRYRCCAENPGAIYLYSVSAPRIASSCRY